MSDPIVPQITHEAHVVPVDDLIEHETEMTSDHLLDRRCPCGPTPEAVKRDDGSVGWVIRHHSLDGRETAAAEVPTTPTTQWQDHQAGRGASPSLAPPGDDEEA